jgi:16S rRNA (uracil1498-N3)-methyltransferase
MSEGPRFYLPDASLEVGALTPLSKEASHHAMRVLRMREFDPAGVFCGNGVYAEGIMHFSAEGSFFETQKVFTEPEPRLSITLIQSLVSHDKMDWIIEKACEIGVSTIVIFPARRGEVRVSGEKIEKRMDRWQKILISSAMQCRRNRLPQLRYAANYGEALSLGKGLKFVTAPSLTKPAHPNTPPESVSFVIGPEGGLTQEEIAEALAAGYQPLLLGPRVLRTETAGLVAAAWAQTQWGDL